ncbi:hypothetical protein F511_26001 [Dorcoceras hygrometricum]|uniref:Uncharacterized protein n=1 Tax=Dorcoceras hygrometricum TaxID=472368 RepID=A0A2Z7DF67_9LAMI|nr:hypothetical protein F511_26001 [Dorcoceras hygrometricum]
MGCPGQARTKPRSKLAIASLSEDRGTVDARRRPPPHIARGTRPHAATTRAAQPRDAPNNWRISLRDTSSSVRPSLGLHCATSSATSCAKTTANESATSMHRPQHDYGPFNPYIPIRSMTIGKSRVVRDPIAMHKSWRSNSDITSVTSIGYPGMSVSGESSTTMHRLLHASEPHPIPPPNDPKVQASELCFLLTH